MVSPPATSEAGAHAAGDTKSEHFEPARVKKLNEKQFSRVKARLRPFLENIFLKKYLEKNNFLEKFEKKN
jgi:hypothetical protein